MENVWKKVWNWSIIYTVAYARMLFVHHANPYTYCASKQSLQNVRLRSRALFSKRVFSVDSLQKRNGILMLLLWSFSSSFDNQSKKLVFISTFFYLHFLFQVVCLLLKIVVRIIFAKNVQKWISSYKSPRQNIAIETFGVWKFRSSLQFLSINWI